MMRFGNYVRGDRISKRKLKNWLHVASLAIVAVGFLAAAIWSNSAVGLADGLPTADAPVDSHAGHGRTHALRNAAQRRQISDRRTDRAARRVGDCGGGPHLRRHVGQAGQAGRQGAPPEMQEVAHAVREGANAYLGAQFKKIGTADYHHYAGPVLHQVERALFRIWPGRRVPARIAV